MADFLISLGVHAMRAITMHLFFEPVNNTVRSLVELLPQEDNTSIPIDTQGEYESRLQYVVRKYTSPIPVSYTHLTLPTNREV